MQQKNSSFALALKILKTLIRWGVWTAIGLYLLIIILLHLPSVQRFVGAQVADALAKKLGTKVRIERVDLGFLNHFIVDGLVIDDQNGRQMAKASRVAAPVHYRLAEIARHNPPDAFGSSHSEPHHKARKCALRPSFGSCHSQQT